MRPDELHPHDARLVLHLDHQPALVATNVEHDTVVAADTLILESGRLPELIFCLPKPEGEDATNGETPKIPADKLEWMAVTSYKNPESGVSSNGLLTKGDVITDFSAAIRAIGAGRRAAASIHKILYDIDLDLPGHVVTGQTIVQNVDHLENVTPAPRHIMPLNNINDVPNHAPELEKGFTESMALAEANRCLKCGLICYADQTINIKEAS